MIGYDGGRGIVHILDFEALENVENLVSGMEVVVDYNCALAALFKGNQFHVDHTYIDQIPMIHDTFDELTTAALWRVTVSPISAEAESLILPGQEADSFHNRWLHYFLAGKDTPSHGVWPSAGSVSSEIAVLAHGIECHARVLADSFDQIGHKLW